jgi:hypothetical protein
VGNIGSSILAFGGPLSRYLELDVLATIFVFAAVSFPFLKLVSAMGEGETRGAGQAILFALRETILDVRNS